MEEGGVVGKGLRGMGSGKDFRPRISRMITDEEDMENGKCGAPSVQIREIRGSNSYDPGVGTLPAAARQFLLGVRGLEFKVSAWKASTARPPFR